MNGICMGNKEKKYVYLTFDEGYEAGYTNTILDVLKKNEVSATFFITAHYVNTQPDLVKRMIDEGHIIGNHTVNHYSMPDLTDEKIKRCAPLITQRIPYESLILTNKEYNEYHTKGYNMNKIKAIMHNKVLTDRNRS